MTRFAIRGVVEGFYGKPWAHEDRLWLLARMGHWGMNTYVYAPKDDPFHLSRWREPYPDAQLAEFRELVHAGARAGVRVGFAVSPGRSIVYSDRADRAVLLAKLGALHALGARVLSLAVDDVPSSLVHETDRRVFHSLADAQLALMRELQDSFGRDSLLWLGPTDYLGVEATEYLEEIGERLDPSVEVSWTGRTVVSPEIRAAEAAVRAATLRRRVLVWDNTPVADGPMRCMLHLNPYTGRDRELDVHVSGILLNPMEHARSSSITLRCAAEYMSDPRTYDAERAWERAVDELGGAVAPALRLFAQAHRFSALTPAERDRELERALEHPSENLRELEALLAARLSANQALRVGLEDRRLLAELEPWLVSHAAETRRMQAALGGLRALEAGAPQSARVLGFFAFEGKLTREPIPSVASYGPRRVLYPQLASMRDETMGFGADPALYTDRCLSDELIRCVEKRARELLSAN
jgi:hyaluronoglucosaminidase